MKGNGNSAQGADLIKQEVVLRLRLANDTMLLIKEKKDWTGMYKKKATAYGTINTSKKNKVAKSYDFENIDNIERLSFSFHEANKFLENRNNLSASSAHSKDPFNFNDTNFNVFRTENNVKSFMNSMRIRKMYNRTAWQDKRGTFSRN